MKRNHFALFVFCLCCLLSCKNAKKEVWVLDQENLLMSSQVNKLDSLYRAHEKKTTNEIALIISVTLPDSSILKSATDLGNQFGVGKKKKDNGIVILVCPRKQQVAIATGYGMEKVLKDEMAKKIIDSLMIPRFREAKYFEAIWEGSLGIIHFLELQKNSVRP